MPLEEANCNGRDAVANESAEALQRRAREPAVCQLQLVVRPRLGRAAATARRETRWLIEHHVSQLPPRSPQNVCKLHFPVSDNWGAVP
jgi:hypothetical protein